MQGGEEFSLFTLFKPHCFLLAIKFKPKECFNEGLLPLPFQKLSLQDWVFTVSNICVEHIVNTHHYRSCDVLQLVPGCGDHNTHEVVYIDLDTISRVVAVI
jgi:hypothetical protein